MKSRVQIFLDVKKSTIISKKKRIRHTLLMIRKRVEIHTQQMKTVIRKITKILVHKKQGEFRKKIYSFLGLFYIQNKEIFKMAQLTPIEKRNMFL